MDKSADIALAAWSQYQDLVRNSSDAIWKIRATFYAIVSALMSAAYATEQAFIYMLVLLASLLFLMLEGGHKRIEIQYIRKSLEIERTLTDILAGEPEPFLPSEGISTKLSTPSLKDWRDLFMLKRYLFWLPYVVVTVIASLLYLYG